MSFQLQPKHSNVMFWCLFTVTTTTATQSTFRVQMTMFRKCINIIQPEEEKEPIPTVKRKSCEDETSHMNMRTSLSVMVSETFGEMSRGCFNSQRELTEFKVQKTFLIWKDSAQ